MSVKQLMTTEELADFLQVHPNSLYNWAREGMPRYKISRKETRYDLPKVLEWLEERGNRNERS